MTREDENLRRLEQLIEIGQFETARDAARLMLERTPDHPRARALLDQAETVLAPPVFGSEDPLARSYRSDHTPEMLMRMQAAVHHQTYAGVQCVKSPFDLAIYHQLVWRVRPGTIIEIGSKAGGSGLFFGDMLRNFDIPGRVLSLDVVPVTGVTHPLVSYEYGDGRALEETLTDEVMSALARPLLVIEDADHAEPTTLATLAFFHRHFVAGDWIVVEDGNLSSIVPDAFPDFTSGPHLALRRFFRDHATDYRVAAEYCDLYAYNGTTASNGILERRETPVTGA
ncbi:MAG: methyltransferase FkbM [Frankiales bacterium]|jgi:cephalosporin hydroxylase|nr:methyltransferase FkbM [Frankiales bacterium]